MSKKKTAAGKVSFVRASVETRNFEFEAFGATEPEARKYLSAAWARHCKLTGADPDYFDQDDVQITEISLGNVLRDGALFEAY